VPSNPIEELKRKISQINIWKRGDERAPHKPLLLLLALARIEQKEDRFIAFSEIEGPLSELLDRYGPKRKSQHPEQPFWRLQNDGIWEVVHDGDIVFRKGSDNPTKAELIRKKATGGLTEEIFDMLSNDQRLRNEVAISLIEAHFPPSLQEDIINDIGLSLEMVGFSMRDPKFRNEVIRAYEHKCAICGSDLRLGNIDLGLEAAHIKWHQAGGPDIVQNGLALCTLHHKALDRGAISLDDELRLIVSAELYGYQNFNEWFLEFKDKTIRKPYSNELFPDIEYIQWHRDQVFIPPARGYS
jgi:putative restriction endonuclease